MITSDFEIVNYIFDDEMIAIDFEYPTVRITFSGNHIKNISAVRGSSIHEGKRFSSSDIYGKVLLSNMNGIKKLFVILKNKTIFSLDDYSLSTIQKIVDNHEFVREMESLKYVESFLNL